MAVDWSGDARAETGTHPRLWVAQGCDGALTALDPSARQGAIVAIRAAADREGPSLVVGLDFAFSYPSWFMTGRGLTSGPDLWDRIDGLAFDRPPFFGWKASRAPAPGRRYRRTEVRLRQHGFPAKSTFQLTGPGSVGTGSRKGMPHLADLRGSGFAVWPFDPADDARPVVAEIYPRVFTGAVVKSDARARQRTFDALVPHAPPLLRARAIGSEDAFDAAVSAVALSCSTGFDPPPEPEIATTEGWVVRPTAGAGTAV
ncbi:MAG: hypothetical protein WKF43_08110 [Acidimicrobiales bacterium]